jgi:hypothetical protein
MLFDFVSWFKKNLDDIVDIIMFELLIENNIVILYELIYT